MNEKLTDFQQLNVWQKAHQLTIQVFELTKTLNKADKAELGAAMRQAAMQIPAKIAEGFIRRNPRDKAYSYRISQDTVEALKYYFILTRDLKFAKITDEIMEDIDEVGRMLSGLLRSTKPKQP